MAATGHLAFVGRSGLLAQCRQAVDAGLDVWLVGESGIGKTALARRIQADAVYIEHVTPAKALLSGLLLEAHKRGWWEPADDEGDALDSDAAEKMARKMDSATATATLTSSLSGQSAVLILDNFDQATPTVVRICRRLAEPCTVIVCSVTAKPSQRPFLFHFTEVKVPRLSATEAGQLTERLLRPHTMAENERRRVSRHIIEQAHGLPSVIHELVKRATARGDLSLRGVSRDTINGHRQIDMTPALIVFATGLMAVRMMLRGSGDHDLTVLLGGSGALFMLVRFYANRMSKK